MKFEKVLIQPIVLFLFMAGLNIGLWVFLNKDQQQGIHEATSITAKQAAIRLERALAARLSMVGHLQRKWRSGTINTQADFKRDALDIHETFSGVQAVNRADAKGVIRWVTPERGNSKAIGVNIRSLPTAAVTFEKAKRTGKPQITKAFDLVQGGKGFVVHFPLGAPGKFEGVVAAVFRIRAIIEEALGKGISENYIITVSEDGKALYEGPDADGDQSHAIPYPASLLDQTWTVTLVPNAATIARGTRESLPLLFGLAILLSAGLALLLRRYLIRQEALRESEQKFRDFANSASDWYWETDENYRFIQLTDRLRVQGVDPASRLGKTRWEITADPDTDDEKWRAHKAA